VSFGDEPKKQYLDLLGYNAADLKKKVCYPKTLHLYLLLLASQLLAIIRLRACAVTAKYEWCKVVCCDNVTCKISSL